MLVFLLGWNAANAVELSPPSVIHVPQDARSIDGAAGAVSQAPAAGRVATSVDAKWSRSKTRQLGGNETWRDRPLAVSTNRRGGVAFADGSAAVHISDGTVGARTDLRSFVRPASESAPIDPLEDPFGDKKTEPRGPSLNVAAPAAVSPASPTPPSEPASPLPAVESTTPPPAVESTPPPPVVQAAPAPLAPAMPAEPPAPARSALPSAPMPYEGNTGNVDFNGRDCRDELGGCQTARDFVKGASIRNISLDITPGYTLAQLDNGNGREDAHEANSSAPRAPSRVFRDREGGVLAEGRFTGFQFGRVWITDANGQTTKIPFSNLSDEDVCFVTAWWSIPTECTLEDTGFQGRHWEGLTLTWKASGVCHKPLYFEEVQLERYGHSAGPFVQPVLSGAHFFLNIAALPYQMGIHPPYECRYPLGYYRPGSCAPWLVPPIPLSVRGGLLAAGVYLGGIYIIP